MQSWQNRLIDYYENSDKSITHYVNELRERKEQFGWTYGKHYGPHDLSVSEWGGPGKTRARIAQEAGLKFTIIPRVEAKNDAIDVARHLINLAWFDEKHYDQVIKCPDTYCNKPKEQS